MTQVPTTRFRAQGSEYIYIKTQIKIVNNKYAWGPVKYILRTIYFTPCLDTLIDQRPEKPYIRVPRAQHKHPHDQG